jgi:hypothetical protein
MEKTKEHCCTARPPPVSGSGEGHRGIHLAEQRREGRGRSGLKSSHETCKYCKNGLDEVKDFSHRDRQVDVYLCSCCGRYVEIPNHYYGEREELLESNQSDSHQAVKQRRRQMKVYLRIGFIMGIVTLLTLAKKPKRTSGINIL